MSWRTCTARASIAPLLLATTLFLAGCSPTTTTLTAETEVTVAADVCRVWLPVIYSRSDTVETINGSRGVRANNAARDAYCRASP